MKYGWMITKDYANEDVLSAVGTTGPGGIDPKIEKKLQAGEGAVFTMYDDDEEKIYGGRLIGLEDDADGFEPLDDFGMPDAGCTLIKYNGDRGYL